MSLLVTDGTILTQDADRRVVQGNLLVEAGSVLEVGGKTDSADRRLDAADCLVTPGFVDGYTRSAHVLLGPPTEIPWEAMREAMAGLQANLTKRDLEVAAAFATTSMLARGTTAFLDLFGWEEEVGRAVTQAGLRACLAWAVEAEGDLPQARRFLRSMRDRDRIRPLIGLTELQDPDLIRAVAEIAQEEQTGWCVPLAERRSDVYRFQRKTGTRPGDWLEQGDFLSSRLIALQCVWLTLNEIRALARGRVPVVHCPVSNQMTGAGGPMPLPEMLREGILVGLGTDSPFLSGGVGLQATMRACGTVHRGHRWDPTVVPAKKLVDMGTTNGAQILGTGTGVLEAGAAADFVVFEGAALSSEPEEGLSLLAYGGRTLRVRDVVVDGKLVVEHGAVQGFDVPELRKQMVDLRRELGLADSGD